MTRILSPALVLTLTLSSACSAPAVKPAASPSFRYPDEKHFSQVRQMTFGGTNAEAYWSFDGNALVLQRKVPGVEDCDQIYRINADGSELRRLSSGKGRTTCSFFLPGDQKVFYSSTFASGDACPAPPDMSRGYVWATYDTFQMYVANSKDGLKIVPMEPGAPRSYNAEGTACHDGSVIFTSDRDGDLDLYVGKADPAFGTLSGVHRVTQTPGYDGGAFFSPDCQWIVWRASRPRKGPELDDYRALLKKHLVRPGELEIWMARADGSEARQVTKIGAASFAPSFTPDGKRIIFASNPRDSKGRSFDLYLINTNGTGLERVTYSDTFESFPMFSPDGRHLAFSSNRNAIQPHETNLFIADWVDPPAPPLSLADTRPADRYLALVEQLAAPQMEGRGPGTAGALGAENLVAEIFQRIGLKPLVEDSFKIPVEWKSSKGQVYKHSNIAGTFGNCSGKKVKPVVIGAHLDHLGLGSPESLEPTSKGLHPGADDNASGVAAVAETARLIVGNPKLANSCFYFVAFTGEESGIIGSSRFVELLKKRDVKPKAMINFDMVGRLRNNTLIAFGSDSAKEWRGILDAECTDHRLTCTGGGDGYGPSDHMAFYLDQVPVLHLFTGPHGDYHRTTDTADKINATGGVQVAELAAAVAAQVASPRQKLTYRKAQSTPTMGKLQTTGLHSKGAYLGTIPDYGTLTSPSGPGGGSASGGGVPLAGVRPGSPAEKAGVQAGDVLLAIGDQPVTTLEGFTKILVGLEPGQKTVLTVRRLQQTLKLPVTVGKRE